MQEVEKKRKSEKQELVGIVGCALKWRNVGKNHPDCRASDERCDIA